ncbi:sirohydrochlorin chelatase [Oxalicibacterium faecigallinarum]|uniref:Cobalamin biosynthesis protein CbiX n=1 Tax=Oxalicibacterium faecigallinarum TaxID=573741 RepID=A0A8J3F0B2_9BURK|nr:CbiX/SirB N-terminal domain-containing protein [Oxalicibacterium faecigallinarum]GGI15814.1 cobalamin biosynthesis protein CbiX [Oxalicibacterium faecigallinarum]
MITRAIVLFAHGARDPRWAEPFKRLQYRVQSRDPAIRVALGFLELMSPRLPELVDDLVPQGISHISIVPVFLGQGGHVMRDLPEIIEVLRQKYPDVEFRIATAVGEDESVLDAMADYCLRAAG